MRQIIGNKKANAAFRIKNVLEAFEHIVELAKDSNLSTDCFDAASAYIRYASRKLALSPMQTVLLALFVDRSENNSILISEIPTVLKIQCFPPLCSGQNGPCGWQFRPFSFRESWERSVGCTAEEIKVEKQMAFLQQQDL